MIKREPKDRVMARVKKELEQISIDKFTGAISITIDCRSGGLSKMKVSKEETVTISKTN